MKRIIFVLMVALAFVACQKGNEEEPNQPHYTKCELTPMQITVPAEGGTFTVKSNIPSYVASCGVVSSVNPSNNLGFGSGTTSIPDLFPHLYESKRLDFLKFPEYSIFKDVYHIKQIDATTYNVTIKPVEGYDGIDLLLLPEEGGGFYGNNLHITIE